MTSLTQDQEIQFLNWPEDEPMPMSLQGPISSALNALGCEYAGEGEWYLGEDWTLRPGYDGEKNWVLVPWLGNQTLGFANIRELGSFINENASALGLL